MQHRLVVVPCAARLHLISLPSTFVRVATSHHDVGEDYNGGGGANVNNHRYVPPRCPG